MKAGRKRTFKKSDALDKAMRVFWQNGYSGTSLTDLTTKLGINKPSLYAAFGNKEKLFQASLEHYITEYAGPKSKSLSDAADVPVVKESLRAYLYNIIDLQTDSNSPGGCFFVKSHCESGGVGFPEEMSSLLTQMQVINEEMLNNFFETKLAEDQFSETAKIKDLTGYFMGVMYGLAVHARTGKTKEELQEIADFSLSMLPVKED